MLTKQIFAFFLNLNFYSFIFCTCVTKSKGKNVTFYLLGAMAVV